MVAVVVICSRLHINPDNVTSPLAASLGDVTTVVLLALFGNALYDHFYMTGAPAFPLLSSPPLSSPLSSQVTRIARVSTVLERRLHRPVVVPGARGARGAHGGRHLSRELVPQLEDGGARAHRLDPHLLVGRLLQRRRLDLRPHAPLQGCATGPIRTPLIIVIAH